MAEPEEQRHIPVQNIFYSITLVVTVCGIMLGAYWNLLQAINAQQVALAGFEARLVIAEKTLQQRQDAEDRFSSEIRSALTTITAGVADLRVQMVKDGGKK
jgi:hypothetical protein